MKKGLKEVGEIRLTIPDTPVPITQTGDKNTAVQHAESVTINNYIHAGNLTPAGIGVLKGSGGFATPKGTDKLSRFLAETVKCGKILEDVFSKEPHDIRRVMEALKSLVKAGRGLAVDEDITFFRDEMTAIYTDLLMMFSGKNGIDKTTPEMKYIFEKRLFPTLFLFIAENGLLSSASTNLAPSESLFSPETDREYYNLIVTTHEIKNSRTSIHKQRVLTGDSDIVKRLADFSEESRTRLKTFPSLIMNENTEYAGRTDPDQIAYFGFITDIKVQQNGLVRVKFRCVAEISQQAINENSDALDIFGGNGLMELNHTHWTIKNIDLIEELTEAGLLSQNNNSEVAT